MARSPLLIAATAILLYGGTVSASPESDAGKHFAEGLRLYAENDFAAAATALKISYEFHADQRTLFAWAQSERRLGNCESSRKLLTLYISSGATGKQSQAAYRLMSDCKPSTTDKTEPDEATGEEDPVKVPLDVKEEPPTSEPLITPPTTTVHQPWYRDWIGVTLLSTGAVGLAFSAFEYGTALDAEDSAAKSGVTYQQFLDHKENAQTARDLSLASGLLGGALIGGGLVYIFVLGPDTPQEQPQVSVGMANGFPSVGISGDF